MSFLAPLFLIGALGISIPIVLHLIRRQAKSEHEFSSLIFLDPSPPTLMQRNRIDQWLLLLLRALALFLLAAAFARPYWKSLATADGPPTEGRRSILLDTSGSMQRDGLWSAAIDRVKAIAQSAQPLESIALYTFDDRVRTIISHEDSAAATSAERSQQVLAALDGLRPSLRATDLGLALSTVGDQLMRSEESQEGHRSSVSEIVLISDLQAGSQIGRLENYQWPTDCKLTIHRIEAKSPANLSASILATNEDSLDLFRESSATVPSAPSKPADESDRESLAIRVSQHGGMSIQKASLRWADAAGKPVDEDQVDVEVDAEGSAVARLPKLASEEAILLIEGDATSFDNQRFVTKPPRRNFELHCLGDHKRPATDSLGYFLEQLPLDDATRQVAFAWRGPGAELPWPSSPTVPLIVVGRDLQDSHAKSLRSFIEEGGHGLWVLDESLEDSSRLAQVQSQWKILTDELPPDIRESKSGEDAMFESIDFQHPIFRSLSDSRFNDFTKIRFWKHRCVAIPDERAWKTIARFDDSFPAIAYRPLGQGMLWLFTSGWQPSESQLALSSKFVPIISGIFSQAAPQERNFDAIVVGDRLECLEGERWLDNDRQELDLETSPDGRRWIDFEQPGFYRMERDGQSRSVAVNLPIAESDTGTLEIERLERLGVATTDSKPTDASVARQEQLRAEELEGSQRIWRWLLLGMLFAIVFETLWSARGQPSR